MSTSDSSNTPAEFSPKPDRAPPGSTIGIYGWLRTNLFSSWFSSVLTVLALLLIISIIPPILNWMVFDAHFAGDSRDACKPNVDIVKDPVTVQGKLPDGTTVPIETTADRVVVPPGVTPNVAR